MQSRLGLESFRKSNRVLKGAEFLWPFMWDVYEEYEAVEQKDGTTYIRAKKGGGGRSKPRIAKYYEPLKTSSLFLDFARIWETPNPSEALVQWIAQNGLLGLTPSDPQHLHTHRVKEALSPLYRYKPEGGLKDTIDSALNEAKKAHYALTLYEAASSKDRVRLENILLPTEQEREWLEDKRRDFRKRMKDKDIDWVDALVDRAVGAVMQLVRSPLSLYTYATIYPTVDPVQKPLALENLSASWGIRNLLGAMYLQFYWLITTGGDVSRCKQCPRIISYAPPPVGSGKRKPRSDKVFCGEECRQRYHYQNRVKPRRQGAADSDLTVT